MERLVRRPPEMSCASSFASPAVLGLVPHMHTHTHTHTHTVVYVVCLLLLCITTVVLS